MSKTVFITGASSGFGLSHAIYLTARGYMVYGTSRFADQLDHSKLKDRYLTDHTKFRYINKKKLKSKLGKLLPQGTSLRTWRHTWRASNT
ncbi:MAG: hypothetical protein ACFFCZ_11290 [Promethearchaeota archaeon]